MPAALKNRRKHEGDDDEASDHRRSPIVFCGHRWLTFLARRINYGCHRGSTQTLSIHHS